MFLGHVHILSLSNSQNREGYRRKGVCDHVRHVRSHAQLRIRLQMCARSGFVRPRSATQLGDATRCVNVQAKFMLVFSEGTRLVVRPMASAVERADPERPSGRQMLRFSCNSTLHEVFRLGTHHQPHAASRLVIFKRVPALT